MSGDIPARKRKVNDEISAKQGARDFLMIGLNTALLSLLLLLPGDAHASACNAGVWALQIRDMRGPGDWAESQGQDTRYCGLFSEGVMVSEFRAFDEHGRVVSPGISLRIRDDDGSEKILWVMRDDPGYTLIHGETKDGILLHEASGTDAMGAFEERSRTIEKPNGDYDFHMDRRYGRIGQWFIDFNVINATQDRTEPPARPALDAMPFVVPGEGRWTFDTDEGEGATEIRRVFLDGDVIVAERTEVDGEQSYSFETRQDDGWRILRWWPMRGKVMHAVHDDLPESLRKMKPLE